MCTSKERWTEQIGLVFFPPKAFFCIFKPLFQTVQRWAETGTRNGDVAVHGLPLSYRDAPASLVCKRISKASGKHCSDSLHYNIPRVQHTSVRHYYELCSYKKYSITNSSVTSFITATTLFVSESRNRHVVIEEEEKHKGNLSDPADGHTLHFGSTSQGSLHTTAAEGCSGVAAVHIKVAAIKLNRWMQLRLSTSWWRSSAATPEAHRHTVRRQEVLLPTAVKRDFPI